MIDYNDIRPIYHLVHPLREVCRPRVPSVVEGVRQFGGRQGIGETLLLYELLSYN